MSDTTTRALSLLNLLQTHRHWPGSELADRLGVTERTVRRDVERLRDLGYRIESTPGVAGGYRLEAGSAVPPLLLTDEEAVAMAIGLRVAASQRLIGGPETTLTALAKLEQVLPAPLRRRVTALADTVQPAGIRTGAAVSSEVLGELALACRDHERVRFTYTAASGEVTRRRVEPYALAPADRHWYLLCWDVDRDDWRTFRVDRLADVEHTRVLFEPRRSRPSRSRSSSSSRARGCAGGRDGCRDGPAVRRDARLVRPVGPGRRPGGRRPHALAGRRRRLPRDDVRHGVDPGGGGVHDRSGEPARSELRETLERMLGRWMPRLRPPCDFRSQRHQPTHSDTAVNALLSACDGSSVSSSRRSGWSRAPAHTGSGAGSTPAVASTSGGPRSQCLQGITALSVWGRVVLPTFCPHFSGRDARPMILKVKVRRL